MISGHGNTYEKANGPFQHNVAIFTDDIVALTDQGRATFFTNLGFKKILYPISPRHIETTPVFYWTFANTTVKTTEVEIIR